MGTLTNYRVVDLTTALAGGVIGMVMGDLGAEVIKVESRTHLDGLRLGWPGKGVTDPEERRPTFHCMGRNKLDITLDLTKPEAVQLLKGLIAHSDVVLENFTPGVMRRLGMDYESLRQINPRIVLVSASGAGHFGPYNDIRAYAGTMGALSGMDSAMAPEGGPPLSVGGGFGDINAGTYAVLGCMAALVSRSKTGKGTWIDLSAWEAFSSLLGEPILEVSMTGRVPSTKRNVLPSVAPHNFYRCAGTDEWIAIAVETNAEWAALCRVMGKADWGAGPQFADAFLRANHREEIDRTIGEWAQGQDSQALTHVLQKAGVGAFASAGYRQQFADPHLQSRGDYVTVDHPMLSGEVINGLAWKFSDTPSAIRVPAPLVGEHNSYVFGEILGLSESEIDRLVEAEVIH